MLGERRTATEELSDPEYRNRIHQWAERWRDRGWPTSLDIIESTPPYLLDSYSGTLAGERSRLVALVSDAGWVDAALQWMGADQVLADLRRAAATDQADPAVQAMLATVSGQAHHLRPSLPLTQPGYVLRQLCLQAAELGEDRLASDLRARLRSQPDPGLIPTWTTRRASRALSAELGRHHGSVGTLAVLPDGRVVSSGTDSRVLVWDPSQPGSGPVELGRHHGSLETMAVFPDGRVVSGGRGGRVLVWDPDGPGRGPVELGRHDHSVEAVAVFPDGRVVSGGGDRRVLVWDPARPGSGPVELGRHDHSVEAVAVLPDGRVVSGGNDGRVLVWDPDEPGSGWVELGRHRNSVLALAVLPDGRVVSGGYDRRVLVWDPARPGGDPIELGHHDSSVLAVVVLPDDRVVSGGYDQVLIWNATTQRQVAHLGCSVKGLASVQASRVEASLVVVHAGHGFSLWSITERRQ